MKNRIGIVACVAAGLAFVSIPGIASADPAFCPPGHAKKGWCRPGQASTMGRGEYRDRDRHHYRDRDRESDRNYDRQRYDDTRYDDRDMDRAYEQGYSEGRDAGIEVGQRLSRDSYRVLDRNAYYDRYGRRLDDRYYYAEADGRQLLIDAATNVIVDILSR